MQAHLRANHKDLDHVFVRSQPKPTRRRVHRDRIATTLAIRESTPMATCGDNRCILRRCFSDIDVLIIVIVAVLIE